MAFFDVDDEIGRGRMFHRGFLPSLAQTAVGCAEFRSELPGDVRKRRSDIDQGLAQTAVGCAEFRSELPGDVRKRRSDIDQGANRLCWGCNQCICKHEDKSAVHIEPTSDENEGWLDGRG